MTEQAPPYIKTNAYSFLEAPPLIGPLNFLAGYWKVHVVSNGLGPYLPECHWEIEILRLKSNNPFIIRHCNQQPLIRLVVDQSHKLIDFDVFELANRDIVTGKSIIDYQLQLVIDSLHQRSKLHINLASIH